MDGILTRNSATSAVPQQAQRVRRKAALSARVFVSAAARGEPMIIPDDLNSSRGSHCSGHQSSMQDKKKSATTTAAVVASASTYMAAASASVTLASIDHEPPSSIDHKPPSSDSIVSSLLLPAAASHSLSRPTINATALSASSLTSIGFSSSGSDSGSDYSSSGVSSNNTSSSSSSSASSSSNNKKKKTALSAHAVQYLKNWMMSPEHVDHPYPTEDEKVLIMNETGIVLKQLTNWFVNNRKRYWKPKVEELRRRQEGDIAGDGGEETRTIEMEFTGSCGGDGNNRNVLIRSSSPVEQGSNTNNKRHSSTRNTKKRSSNNDDDDGSLPTAKKTRNSSSSSITDGTTILSPTPIITMLLPPTTTAPSYLPSLRDDMKLNMTRVNGTNCSGTSVVSDESGSGRGSGTEEESGDDIDDDIQHVSNPLFDKSSYSSLDVMESSSSSDIELRTAHQQVMNMIDMDYSFNPLNMEETITTKDHHHQQQHQEEEHICCSILPHSCTDPKSHSIQPCALCSACRDWNLGEFCPWDLTGILGDLSTDYTMLQAAEGSESMTMVTTSTTAGVANDVIPIFSDEDGSSTHNCETISLNLSSTNIDDATTIPIEPTMMSTTMYSNLSVPQEISHSTSAMNFMADIESWD